MCRTITDVNVKRQRSHSICAMSAASFDVQHVEKDWFYKLNILVDDCNLHLINDRRLQTKYMTLYRKFWTTEERVFNTSLKDERGISEFELIYQQMDGSKTMTICDCAKVKDTLDLVCRFLLAKGVEPLTLKEAVMLAMNNQLPKIAKAVAWCLTRKFVQDCVSTHVLRYINDIWPGFRCLCRKNKGKGHSKICSEELVIMVEFMQQVDCMQVDYFGIPVEQICTSFDQPVAQDKEVPENEMETCDTNDDDSRTPIIESDVAEIYFKNHTKLTMVYILPGKPTLVQFCCQVKKTIPIGEDHFPSKAQEFDTKVEEGYVRFMTNIRIGDNIRVIKSGTLGGFVQVQGFNAFLTCAHVIYDRQILMVGDKRERHRTRTKVFKDQGTIFGTECGYVWDWKFEEKSPKKVSIDAAVILLNEDKISIDEKDIVSDGSGNPKSVEFLGMNGPYLNDNYITLEQVSGVLQTRSIGITSRFFEGNIKFEKYDDEKNKFKDKEHGLPLEFDSLSTQIEEIEKKTQKSPHIPIEVHIQQYILPQLEDSLKFDRRQFRFYRQLLLEDFPFKPGDSGTCIYVIQDRTTQRPDCKPNPTGCLAMAIASYHDKRTMKEKCVATPMEAILQTFGLI